MNDNHAPLTLDLIKLISRRLGILACLLRLSFGLNESGFDIIESFDRFQVGCHTFDVCVEFGDRRVEFRKGFLIVALQALNSCIMIGHST